MEWIEKNVWNIKQKVKHLHEQLEEQATEAGIEFWLQHIEALSYITEGEKEEFLNYHLKREMGEGYVIEKDRELTIGITLEEYAGDERFCFVVHLHKKDYVRTEPAFAASFWKNRLEELPSYLEEKETKKRELESRPLLLRMQPSRREALADCESSLNGKEETRELYEKRLEYMTEREQGLDKIEEILQQAGYTKR